MNNKNYHGLVVVAPPHLNPKYEANRYVFSGVQIPTDEDFACFLRIIPLPESLSGQSFSEDVALRNPLQVELELFASAFDFGRLRYVRVETGETASALADDVTGLAPEEMSAPRQPVRAPGQPNEVPELTPPESELSTPGLEF